MTENIIFLDLETTSLDTSKCEVIECAYFLNGEIYKSLFKPNSPIPPEVSGITNIDNPDVEYLQPFIGSEMLKQLVELSKQDYIICTHNTDFDLGVLEAHGVKFKRSICTYKLAWKLYKNKLQNHKLGTLRATYQIPYSGEAHRADYDVKILIEVFKAMVSRFDFTPIEKMVEASDQAKYEYLNTFPFGKFKGQQIDISNREHSGYIDWLLKNTENMDPKFKQHLFELKNFND